MDTKTSAQEIAQAELRKNAITVRRIGLYQIFLNVDEHKPLPSGKDFTGVTVGRDWTGGRGALKFLRDLPNLKEVSFDHPDFTDDWAAEMKYLPRLEAVFFTGGLTDQGLAHIADMHDLLAVAVDNSSVTDKGLRYIEDKVKLRYLNFAGTKITDDGLAHLKKLKNLEILFLEDTLTTGKGLVHLKGLTKLRRLRLSDRLAEELDQSSGLEYCAAMRDMRLLDASSVYATDNDLRAIANMEKLEKLFLSYSCVTDEGLAHLAGLKHLQRLELNRSDITSAGLKYLKYLQNLEYLNLAMNRGIDDTALPHLLALKKLKAVEMLGTTMSLKAKKELEDELENRRATAEKEQDQQGQ